MKKVLALVLSLIFASLALAGCDVQKTDETTQKDLETTLAEATQAETKKETQKAVNEEEEILKQAKKITEAQSFLINFGYLNHDKDVFLSGEKSPYPEVEKYYLLTDYKTKAEFKKKALSYYSEKTANDEFFKYSENKADWEKSGGPFMIEYEGRAYADVMRFGIASALVYKDETVKVKSVDGSNAVIEVEYFYDREPEIVETQEYKMVKENGIWVFDELVR